VICNLVGGDGDGDDDVAVFGSVMIVTPGV